MADEPPTGDAAAMRSWLQAKNGPYLAVIREFNDTQFVAIQPPTLMSYVRLLWGEAHRRLGQATPPLTADDREFWASKRPTPQETPVPRPRTTRYTMIERDWL